MTDRTPHDEEARLTREMFGVEPATDDQLAAARASGLLAPEGADEDEAALRDEEEALDDFLGQHVPGSGEWWEMG